MITKDEVEGYLDRLGSEGASYTEIDEGLWLVKPGGALDLDVVVNYSPPVLMLRVKVMDIPEDADESSSLNRRLLELNASDMNRGSYGIDGDAVVLTEAMDLSRLDHDEFVATFESMTMALASHLREFATHREGR